MSVALPLPYEDELLSSDIARYMEETEVSSPSTVLKNLFQRRVEPRMDLINGLAEFSRQTHNAWGLSALQIAQRHTLLPYFLAYMTDERQTAAYEAIAGGGKPAPSMLVRAHACALASPCTLMFCHQCATEDVLNGRRPYLRRSHQLPGVFFCQKHGRLLRSLPDTPDRPTSSVPEPIHDAAQRACNEDVLNVMRASLNLLSTNGLARTFPLTPAHWFSLAKKRGFVTPGGYLDTEAIRDGIAEMYGREYLGAIGAMSSRAPIDWWAVRMMRREGQRFHPLQHILLGHFLERQQAETSLRLVGRLSSSEQPATFPNLYARRGALHLVARIRINGRTERA
ncbi:TniQ protein [Paraburkholderia steynii]|uniref:TniQ protein n=1 Tax=Paraburkholderia steynii TaxID=1245441 RepID=A0A7Z7BA55_9BURK|nr:TniQ family protein [Paraburkholderia steynii]SDI39201.1 TniQ protein [Paraburkholderia steynii]